MPGNIYNIIKINSSKLFTCTRVFCLICIIAISILIFGAYESKAEHEVIVSKKNTSVSHHQISIGLLVVYNKLEENELPKAPRVIPREFQRYQSLLLSLPYENFRAKGLCTFKPFTSKHISITLPFNQSDFESGACMGLSATNLADIKPAKLYLKILESKKNSHKVELVLNKDGRDFFNSIFWTPKGHSLLIGMPHENKNKVILKDKAYVVVLHIP
jgi:hypothetical protein